MLHELKPNEGARKTRKRVGRGIGSGHGKTSGKGSKGQLSRSGNQPRIGFEGGQIPFFQRLPKRGFKNVNYVIYATVNLKDLNVFENGDVVTPEVLLERKIIRKLNHGLKVLAYGDLEKKITVRAHAFSKKALDAINQAGGTAEVI